MEHETKTQTRIQTNHQFGRLPKGERRVRFADSMGMELVSIFLFDLISNCYLASFHSHKAIQPPPTIHKQPSSHKPPSSSLSSSSAASALLANSELNRSKNQLKHTSYQLPTNNNNNHFHSTNHYSSYNNNNNNNNNNINYNNYNNNTNTTAIKQTDPSPATAAASYICEFTQPTSLLSFKERVKLNKVHLETCQVNSTAGHVSVSCTIRVLNVSYDKSVIVRYTTDDWRTHTDSLASFKPGSRDGWSDRFTSTFTVTNQVKSFQQGQRVIFAVRYTFNGENTHWDNNGGLNYSIKKLT